MKIKVAKNYTGEIPNLAASYTAHGGKVKAPKKYWFRNEHSPARLFRYVIELYDIPTFVSVHLVRHGIFANHFVASNRDDLYIDPSKTITRDTPLQHLIETNAVALIAISRKRLCYKSHRRTVAVWLRVVRVFKTVEPDLHPFLVPECVYRNGICPEATECKPTLKGVMKAYKHYPLLKQ